MNQLAKLTSPGAQLRATDTEREMRMCTYEKKRTRFRLSLVVLAAVFALAGCAAQVAHRDGLALLQQGKFDAGVSKLEEAAIREPANTEYHMDLQRAREKAAAVLIQKGNAARFAGQLDAADAAYAEAMRIDSGSGRARVGLDAVAVDRRHAVLLEAAQAHLKKGDLELAVASLKPIFIENANNGGALQLQREIDERQAKELAAVPTLRATLKSR